MTWHVIHTKPKQEKRALENLQKQDFECFLPSCSIEKIRRGRIAVSSEPLFPRYLFINLKQGTNWTPIRSTLGVQNLVKFGTEAAKVPDDLIETLRTMEDRIQNIEPERLFSEGDKVQIISGPFAGLEGIYQMTDGETRAMVLIELLRKPAKGHFEITQLRKIG